MQKYTVNVQNHNENNTLQIQDIDCLTFRKGRRKMGQEGVQREL